MSKQTYRILDEAALIEHLLHLHIDKYDPTGDEYIDESLRALQHTEVQGKADLFVTTLYAVIRDMTFDDWQDFWLDMGIRVFGEPSDGDAFDTGDTDPDDGDAGYLESEVYDFSCISLSNHPKPIEFK